MKSAAGLVGGHFGAHAGAALGTAILPGVGAVVGGLVGAVVTGIASGFVADTTSDKVLGVDDNIFVQYVYDKVLLELQSQFRLSAECVVELMSRLQPQVLQHALIKERENAFYIALKAGQQILHKD